MSNLVSDTYKKIPQPNFTQIPNIIFDFWMKELDHSSSLVLFFLCRKTFGWQKIKDCLSLRQIQEGVQMSKQTVVNSLKILESHGLIKKQMHINHLGDQNPNSYELIVDEEGVQNLDNPVQNLDNGGSLEFRQGVVQNLDTQNKPIQNKNSLSMSKQEEFHPSVHGFLKISKVQYQTLCEKHGKEKVDRIAEDLDLWIGRGKAKKETNHYLTLISFIKKDKTFQEEKKNYAPNSKRISNKRSIIQTGGEFVDGKPVESPKFRRENSQ